MRHGVAVLLEVLALFAFRAHQEEAHAREQRLADKRIVDEDAAFQGQRIDFGTRREDYGKGRRQGVAVEVLDTARKRNRVRRIFIEHGTRREFERLAAHFELHLLFDRRRNGYRTARDARINPFIEFQLHVQFVRMVRRHGRRVDRRHTRRQLVFGATARSHLGRTRKKPRTTEQA